MTHYEKPYIIAEAGCNHKGDMEIAKELINVAAMFCHADAIKFQKRCPKELLTPEQYNAPHPNPCNAYGDTYGAHREFLEFTVDQHAQLKEWCEEAGITYSTSVWDMTSAKEIASLKPKFIKIPSACNTHFEMLQWLCDNYQGEIQLSFGMTTHAEEEQIVTLFENNGRAKDLVLFNCTSGYPVVQFYSFDNNPFALVESAKRVNEAIDGNEHKCVFGWITAEQQYDETMNPERDPDMFKRMIANNYSNFREKGITTKSFDDFVQEVKQLLIAEGASYRSHYLFKDIND